MHGYTCKSLLNTLGRAVEQLAGCLAKQAKSQQSRSKYMTVSKRVCPFSRQWHQVTPIAPPTGCGIRPVPNRNQEETIVYLSRFEGGFSTQTGLRWMPEIRCRQPYILLLRFTRPGRYTYLRLAPPPYVNLTSFLRPPRTRTSLK